MKGSGADPKRLVLSINKSINISVDQNFKNMSKKHEFVIILSKQTTKTSVVNTKNSG